MTGLRFTYTDPTGDPIKGGVLLDCRPTRRTVNPDMSVALAQREQFRITTPGQVIYLPAPPSGQAWKIREVRDGGVTRFVRFDDTDEILDWGDPDEVRDVDPATLQPAASPDAAWVVELNEVRDLITVGNAGPAGPAGAPGEPGPAGPAGATGPAGAAGAPGAAGAAGATGPAGATGAKGADGTSFTIKGTVANQAALPGGATSGDGYITTTPSGHLWVWSGSVWVDAGQIQGPTGATGATGSAGPQGATGATGAQGPAGTAGSAGAQGPTGPAGAQGPAGPAGTAGATGAVGPQGLQGVKGDKGDTGAQGPAGSTGATGATGAQGSTGPAGATGARGPVGATYRLDPAKPHVLFVTPA